MPYRDAPGPAPRRSSEGGIVDEMVRQFADRHAFVRELVQNAIDAGATRVSVSISRPGDGTITTSVDDDGTGMTRAIIEGPFLTLFSSSKEDDPTKIGKYGVGFVSVFATEPEQVEVLTWRPEGTWRVRLFGDHTFELEREEPRPGHGTIVTLLHRLPADASEAYVVGTTKALERWCRHAHLPLALWIDGGVTDMKRPLDLDAVVTHREDTKDETILVGLGPSFAGFYNRGLTLYETTEWPGLRPHAFKVDSPRLGHTISRDDVKRDGAFQSVMARVRALIEGPLQEKAIVRFNEASAAGDVATCRALFGMMPGVDPKKLFLPSVRGQISIAKALDAQPFISAGPSPIQEALERRGRVLVNATFAPFLARFSERAIPIDVEAWALAVPVERADDALLQEIATTLRAAGAAFEQVRFGAFSGARSSETFRWVTSTDGLSEARRIETAGATLFFNVDDPAVRLARKKTPTALAGHVLARIVLLETGPISKAAVDAMLGAARG